MSGRHVEDVLPPSATQKLGEDCALLDDELADLVPKHGCRHDQPGWRCCHGGHGRHRAGEDR